MKKTLVSIAAASLLALNFTGCGSSSSSTPVVKKEVKVAGIASIVDASVKSGALTASELGNGFYNFTSQPSEKVVSTGGFVDYNNNNLKDAGEPSALTLSANAGKSTLNAFTTLVTESSKSEQEIADLLGLSVADLNSDTSLASLEVQKRVVLANAIVKQAQSGSSATVIAPVTTTPVASGTTTDTTASEATSTESTSTTTNNAPASVLPSIDGSSTVAVATTTETATTETATTETATTETATTTTTVETADILPSIGRSLRADSENSTTPPVLPTVGTATVTATTVSDTTSVLPSTDISINKYDELLAQISSKVTAGESIYMAVANVTGVSELANLESATDAVSIQSINTALLTVSTIDGSIIPGVDTTPVDGTTDITPPVVDTTPTGDGTTDVTPPVDTTDTTVIDTTPVDTTGEDSTTTTSTDGTIDENSVLASASAEDVSDEQNIGTADEQIGVSF